MTPNEVRNLHLALRTHFLADNYDYFRYRGKLLVDNHGEPNPMYAVLANKYRYKRELEGLFVSNIVVGNGAKFVDWYLTEDARVVWLDWLKRTEALTHYFRKDLEQLKAELGKSGLPFRSLFELPTQNSIPKLLSMYWTSVVSLETMLILVEVFKVLPYWDANIVEDYMWPDLRRYMVKYRPFIRFDLNRITNTIKEVFDQPAPIVQPAPTPKRDRNTLSDDEWSDLISSISQ